MRRTGSPPTDLGQISGLPALLMIWATATPDAPAVLQKRRGRWQPLSWAACAERVQHLALALDGLGVGPGDVVVQLLATSRDAWFLDLGAQALGARSAAIDPDAPASEVTAALVALAPSVVAVEGLELADEVLDLVDNGRVGHPQLIVRHGADALDDATSFDELAARGRARSESEPDRYGELATPRSATDVVAVTVEFAATGQPVLLDVTADALVASGRATVEQFSLTGADLAVSVTSLAHTVERGTTYAGALSAGASIGFPETPASALAAVVELQPTFLHATPTFWRAVATGVRSRLAHNRGSKRLVRYLWERSSLTPSMVGRPVGAAGRFLRFLVGTGALRKLGMDRLRVAVTTGSVVSAGHLQLLSALGLDVQRGYGSVRSIGLLALCSSLEGDVELPSGLIADTQIEVGDDGSVEVSGAAVCGEGWAVTGDRARRVADSEIRLVGSGSALPDGSYPAEIEAQICSSMYVEHVALYQDGDETHGVIEIDATATGDWARRQGLEFTTFESLCSLESVRGLIGSELERLGTNSLAVYRLLPEPLRRRTGDLTINREINRNVVGSLKETVGAMVSPAPRK